MAAVTMAATATGVSQALSASHDGLRRVAAPVVSSSRCAGPMRSRRVVVQAIAEPIAKASPRTIEECEADVVAGNASAAPAVPPKPKAPEGTPRISPLVRVRPVSQGFDSCGALEIPTIFF